MAARVRLPGACAIPCIGIALVALATALFFGDAEAYQHLLRAWMLNPFPHPFMDWEFIPEAVECWKRGVDVYVATPCYAPVPTLALSYSPLWLRLGFLPTGDTATAILGLTWAVLFFASLAYLPPPRSVGQFVVTLLLAVSSLVAFAVERGNVDLIIFLLALSGAALWQGSLPSRLLAYAVFLLAAMLKYYPLVLLLLALRERPRAFVAIAAAATLAVVVPAVKVRAELMATLRNIPQGSYFTDLFGAVNLPYGLPRLLASAAQQAGLKLDAASFAWTVMPAYVLLWSVMLTAACWLSQRGGLQAGVDALPPRHRALLLVGALLLCGCFFAGQSVGYRGIYLVLVLPGLLRLRSTLPPAGAGAVTMALACVLLVAWVLTIEYVSVRLGLTPDYAMDLSGYGLVHWLFHELAWWWLIGVLTATVISFALRSMIGLWLVSVARFRWQPL